MNIQQLQSHIPQISQHSQASQQMNSPAQYNLDSIPGDWVLAIIHQSAHKVGIAGKQICQCCGYHVCEFQLKLSVDKEDLSFLGSGYPLYFTFIKNCIFLLCLHLMAAGQFNIISNYQGQDCRPKKKLQDPEDKVCLRDIVTIFSLANRKNDQELLALEDILTLSSTFLMMVFLIYFRKNQKKLDVFCDLQELTPSDYTVMAYNIDQSDKLKQYFEIDLFKLSRKMKVKKINLAYDLSKINELKEQKNNILNKKKQCFLNQEQFNEEELEDVNNKLEEQKKKCNFTGLAFVSFKYERMKSEVIQIAKKQYAAPIINTFTGLNFNEGRSLDYYGHPIYVEVAPEPTDINWNVIYIWANHSIYRRIFGAVINIIVNFILSVVVYLSILKQVKVLGELSKNYNDNDTFNGHYIKVHLYSLGYSMITVFINSFLLQELTRAIVSFQAYPTFSQVSLAIASKLSFMMFLNSVFMQCLIALESGNVYYAGGLAYNMTYFFISNAFIPPIIQMLDISSLVKSIKQYYYKKYGILTQQELNELLEFPEHKIEESYAEVLKTMNVTFFVGPLVPLGYIFSIIGLILFYWAEKYQLLRKKTVKHTPSFQLSSKMTDSLQLIPIIHILSTSAFKYFIQKNLSLISIIGLIISLIYHFIPNNKLVALIWDFGEHDEYEKYCDSIFPFNYDRENPITQQKALRRWLKRQQRYEQRKEKRIKSGDDYATLKQKEKEIKLQLELFQ
ncbi:unnamed protein product [Paramecium sonneborni]|uniref:CSC1/OSCA1-like cytosolic domain-containing protein n=1 Tax=Paramecium sonneborni TaxID=65129 RepID=A0A8S1KHW9_9CILI|nr:unnamed protein product [Paramecium sonneborni]